MTALTTMPALPSLGDSYAAYIRAVETIPSLTETEEKQLVAQYLQHNDLVAARKLAMAHLRLVVAVARGYSGYGLEQGDLVQEGNIGLLKAVQKFNPNRGARLATFAVYWIRAEIHGFIMRNWRIIKIATTKAHRSLFFKMRHLFQNDANGNLQSAQTVADKLGVTASDVADMRARLHNTSCVALSAEKDERATGADTLLEAPAETADPEKLLLAKRHNESTRHELTAAFAELDERSRAILQSRRLQDKPATLQSLARQFHISVERVRQLENRALQTLRRHLQAT